MISQQSFHPHYGESPNILIVDDLKENHRVFNSVLRGLDANIYRAYSGEDAVSLTLRHQFAVVLLDVMMPGMDGYETANLLRINEETRLTPIIFVTAMEPDDDFECRGYDVGAVDYLFKPIKPQALAGKVKVFIELERQRNKIRQTLDAIQQLESRNDLLLKSVGEGILGLDQNGTITFSNPAAQSLLGYYGDELEKISFMDIMSVASTDETTKAWEHSEIFNRCNNGLGYHETFGVFRNNHNEQFPVEYLATPIRDKSSDAFVGVVVAFQDVTERKKTEEQLARLAQVDTLTGLYNRYSFGKQLAQSLARGDRQQRELALLFIDLDKFKQVNDNLGHDSGDLLLRQCADRLLNCIREGDILSRIGGDEFTAILESISGGRDAAAVAEKIINEINKPFTIHGVEIFISASIGISTFPDCADNADALLRCSDIAMYKAKQAGRNGYQFFTEDMQQEVSKELELENALRNAIQRNEFSLVYQPKIDPNNGRVVGVEALLRWKDKAGNNISPETFIGKAEEMGLILDIGEWVLLKGCEQMCQWRQAGHFNNGETIAINLSVRQLISRDLLNMVANTLDKTGIRPENLELEITETMMMQNPEKSIQILGELHKLGIKITIDDFGTGYSSLSHLRQMPLDCLKIDKSFVQSMEQANGTAIVKAIIGLGKNMNLKIVAEGAETESQRTLLMQFGVDSIQGYYYSKPLTAEQCTQYLVSDH